MVLAQMGDGNQVTWKPGQADTGNLLGRRAHWMARWLEYRGADGAGLISREGWAVVDDSTRPLFDSADFSFKAGEKSPWPWVLERPSGKRQDWYFFGYGHDYRKALGDYVRVAGRIPLPPRFAFGPGGRATGITATRNSMSWCAASTRTMCR